jgi:uncharacterized membrane protein
MPTLGLFPALLLAATFLCALVAGLVFAFAVVAMPGIRGLSDGAFIRAFQGMDRIIQDNQPLFMVVWVGSVVLVVAAAALGFGRVDGLDRVLLVGAALVYVVGVQLPTVAVNVPLNNRLQRHDVGRMTEAECRAAREAFEPRWNRWNRVRTVLACGSVAALLTLLYRL